MNIAKLQLTTGTMLIKHMRLNGKRYCMKLGVIKQNSFKFLKNNQLQSLRCYNKNTMAS